MYFVSQIEFWFVDLDTEVGKSVASSVGNRRGHVPRMIYVNEYGEGFGPTVDRMPIRKEVLVEWLDAMHEGHGKVC